MNYTGDCEVWGDGGGETVRWGEMEAGRSSNTTQPVSQLLSISLSSLISDHDGQTDRQDGPPPHLAQQRSV